MEARFYCNQPSIVSKLVVVDITPTFIPNDSSHDYFLNLMKQEDLETGLKNANGNLGYLRANLMKKWEHEVQVR